ncbi:MAG: hypothetical protein K2X95_00365 [Flavobacteriaceae bacterium]|nr:hypothetical protein [Flavobacteriaceae bacterium]
MKNWKTTSAGIAMIAGGIVGLYFAITTGNVTEVTLTSTIATILGGIGLIFGADAPAA